VVVHTKGKVIKAVKEALNAAAIDMPFVPNMNGTPA
jgi:hypothetical protein